jgi:dihydrodipicolinate synthase/N-acetylneuraminate lyase
MKNTAEVVRVKSAYAWIEQQRVIHLKAGGTKGEPVELTAEETRRLAERLMKLANVLEALQAEENEGTSD